MGTLINFFYLSKIGTLDSDLKSKKTKCELLQPTCNKFSLKNAYYNSISDKHKVGMSKTSELTPDEWNTITEDLLKLSDSVESSKQKQTKL